MKKIITLFIVVVFLNACGKDTKALKAHYVSPMEYRGYNCQQLEVEMVQTSNRAQMLAGPINDRAAYDAVALAGGFIVWWPSFFLIQGNSPKAKYYARLKGEFEALEKAAEQKECNIEVKRYSLDEAQEQ